MHHSKLMLRASLIALAFGLTQGCAGLPDDAKGESFTDVVVEDLYTVEAYVTGSRIPRKVDQRRSIGAQSPQPLRVFKIQQ